MRKHTPAFSAACIGIGMLILIIDTKTAISGAAFGIDLCIKTVIPSLLPFFLFSNMLTAELARQNYNALSWLGKIFRIPKGTEHIYLVGAISGYPVGASMLGNACRSGQISQIDGNRMIAFCSNPGPAFIFGIGSCIFAEKWLCWVIWIIIIISGFVVAVLTPAKSQCSNIVKKTTSISLTDALKKSILTMALVCGWVVLFRVVIAVLDRWLLWILNDTFKAVIYGFLELSNGCCNLEMLQNTGMRLILFTMFLSFGGLCVMLQTISVLDGSGIRPVNYLAGKITQTAICLLLCQIVQLFLPDSQQWNIPWWITALAFAICIIHGLISRKYQKPVAIPQIMVYNEEKFT